MTFLPRHANRHDFNADAQPWQTISTAAVCDEQSTAPRQL
jgi:hypothetical protein